MSKLIRIAAWVALASLLLNLAMTFFYYPMWLEIVDVILVAFINLGIYLLARREKIRPLKIVAILLIIATIILYPLELYIQNQTLEEESLMNATELIDFTWSVLVIAYGLALRPLIKKFGKTASWASWTQIIAGALLLALLFLLSPTAETGILSALLESVNNNFYFISAFFEMLLLFQVSGKPARKQNLLYRNVGISLLVAAILIILSSDYFIIFLGWLSIPEFLPRFRETLAETPITLINIILELMELAFWLILIAWIILTGIILIKNNKYTKQLLYIEYGWLIFILYRAAYKLSLFYLITGLLGYYLFIKQDNWFSRLAKGKKP